MGLLSCELRLSFTVIRYGVEHSVLHKDADGSTDERGEEMNVDVIASAVETPETCERDRGKHVRVKEKVYRCCSVVRCGSTFF